MKGINTSNAAQSHQPTNITSDSSSKKTGDFNGKKVTAHHSGITHFLAATFRGIESKILAKALPARHIKKNISTEAIRVVMRDARNDTAEAIKCHDMRGVRLHGQVLCDNARTALHAGDAPLCNGGVLALGGLGSQLVTAGEIQTARQVAYEIVEFGKEALVRGEKGTATTANVALRLMRHQAQIANNTKLADTLLRSQLSIINEHGGGLADDLIRDGIAASKANATQRLKTVLEEGKALARSASKKDFPESIAAATRTYETLATYALEKNDEPLANAILLEYIGLAETAAHHDNTNGLISVALSMNRVGKAATEHGHHHTPLLVNRLHSQLRKSAQHMSGGVAHYLAQYPLDSSELQTAADETFSAAAACIAHDAPDEAIEYIDALQDIATGFVLRNKSESSLTIAEQLSTLGKHAAKKSQLGVLDHITDTLTALSECCDQSGAHTLAANIAMQQLAFPSAWDVALKHSGTETEKIVHYPPSFPV